MAAMRAGLRLTVHALDRPMLDGSATAAREALGDTAFEAAWQDGQRLTPTEALADVLQSPEDGVQSPASGPPKPSRGDSARDGLSPREIEVLRLVAQGHTDREVAEALFISRRTVTTHVTGILNKLGVENRAAAAVWAARNGLA
jgi:DNA-binding CsgD family transcriptional regulator